MLNAEELKEIFIANISNYNDKYKIAKTVIKSTMNDEEYKEILKLNAKNLKWWCRLVQIVTKKIIIAEELIDVRNYIIFDMLYGEFKVVDFSIEELMARVNDTSNVWLSLNSAKIRLLKGFCNNIIGNSQIMEQICKKEIEKDNNKNILDELNKYKMIREEAFKVFDHLILISQKIEQELLDIEKKKEAIGAKLVDFSPTEIQKKFDLYYKNAGCLSLTDVNSND